MSRFVFPGMASPPFLPLPLLFLYKYASGCCCTSEEPGVSSPCERKKKALKEMLFSLNEKLLIQRCYMYLIESRVALTATAREKLRRESVGIVGNELLSDNRNQY